VFYSSDGEGREQSGVVRTNCIDSLDRTNVAQFIVARAALSCMVCSFQCRPCVWD
jgi:hypothetical protein